MARKPPLRRFTVFLIKEDVPTHSAALRDASSLTELAIQGLDGVLVSKPRRSKSPWWVDFLRPHVSDGEELDRLFNSSTSAVICLRASGRFFALTFGYGRNLLEPTSYERDFGLKVVLNTVAPDQLKSVDARTFDDLTLHTRRDVSQASSIEAFGLDVSRDLVRAVTGQPRDPDFARRVTGSDGLALNARDQFDELPEMCSRLLKAYKSEHYKERFGWIDQLRPVSDPGLVQQLDEALLTALNEGALEDIHLAPPEPMDWERVAGFRFSTEEESDEPYPDPPISAYLRAQPENREELTLEALKHDRVLAVSAEEGQVFTHWSVYRCLVFETRQDDRLYALSAGDWFSVSESFADEVQAFVRSLDELSLQLPEAPAGCSEGEYNELAAREIGALCMDGKLVTLPGRTPIELCDLLGRDKHYIHVKKRGSSSTLSHLFMQGVVSSEMLLRDPSFRTTARSVVDGLDPSFSSAVPTDRPGPQEVEVSFVVVTRSTRDTPLTLPFFSLVSLRAAALQLTDLGFKVSVLAVKEPRSSLHQESRPETARVEAA